MSILHSIIFGIIQGLTEFLPISSSAHLEIVGRIAPSFSDPGAAFTAIIQIGTQCAILVLFWNDIIQIIKNFFTKKDMKMGFYIIIGSMPIIIVGLVFQKLIKNDFRNLYLTAIVLILFGAFLYFADKFGKKNKSISMLSIPKTLFFGLAQSLAVIPGVSRSGGTITAGLLMGFDRVSAAKYSFLLSIPSVFGSGFYELYSANDSIPIIPTIVATIVSFVVGFFTVKYFMKMISTKTLTPFIIYRLLLGFILILILIFGNTWIK